MKNRHIWLFYISFLGIHFSNLAQNQNDLISNDTIIIKSDSLIKKDYKLRFGFDPVKTILSQTDKNYKGIEIIGDLNLFNNLFLTIELGTEDKTKQSEKINFWPLKMFRTKIDKNKNVMTSALGPSTFKKNS